VCPAPGDREDENTICSHIHNSHLIIKSQLSTHQCNQYKDRVAELSRVFSFSFLTCFPVTPVVIAEMTIPSHMHPFEEPNQDFCYGGVSTSTLSFLKTQVVDSTYDTSHCILGDSSSPKIFFLFDIVLSQKSHYTIHIPNSLYVMVQNPSCSHPPSTPIFTLFTNVEFIVLFLHNPLRHPFLTVCQSFEYYDLK
jgi:hypothetical protein